MPQRPSSRADHFDDVATGSVHVRNIRSINPRMACPKALLPAAAHDDRRPGEGWARAAHVKLPGSR
jgi:hypothetical protein